MKIIRICYLRAFNKMHELTYPESYGIDQIVEEISRVNQDIPHQIIKIETYNLVSTNNYKNGNNEGNKARK